MAKQVKYVGLSDVREISHADFKANDIDHKKVTWTKEDHTQELSDDAAAFLCEFDEFTDVTDLDAAEKRKVKPSAETDQTINHDPDEENEDVPDNVVPGSATGGRSVNGGDTGTGTTGNGSSTAGAAASGSGSAGGGTVGNGSSTASSTS